MGIEEAGVMSGAPGTDRNPPDTILPGPPGYGTSQVNSARTVGGCTVNGLEHLRTYFIT
jgi:hypothetical protein